MFKHFLIKFLRFIQSKSIYASYFNMNNNKKSFVWLITFGILLISACKQTDIVEIKDENNHVAERYEVKKNSTIRSGSYTRFYPDGNIQEEAIYKNGKLEGQRKIFLKTGQLEILENYLDGQFQGKFNSYYPNGKINVDGQYLNGEMHGLWKRYYDTGELMEETIFENNDENGPFKEFYKNGKLKAEGNYLNGPKENGELRMYDENGELVKTMHCENGECHTTWEKK